jgi:hypothetical protein
MVRPSDVSKCHELSLIYIRVGLFGVYVRCLLIAAKH